MKATFEAHRKDIQGLDHCDKLGTATIVTVVREEGKTPEMLIGRGFKHCDKFIAENYVTVPANSNREPGFEEELVAYADDALITVAGHPNATDEGKEPTEAEHPDLSNAEKLPLRCFPEAKLLGHFCTVVLNRLRDCESRTEEWKQIIGDYNSGKLVPELYQMRKKRCERTIRTWIEQYLQADYDMFALIHSNWNTTRKRKVSEIESQILLSMLLHPNRVKIGSAIKLLKAQARLGYFDSQSSIPTLRRWCRDWMNANPAIWNQARLGSKFVAELIIKTIHRDSSLLKVGDVWVADGHNLAFDILNPKTGKAKRMTLILVLDWASRYPVGASLAFTEDSQHILAAFRNGFLNTSQWMFTSRSADSVCNGTHAYAFLPRYVYLDNGRAFKSKLFHENWEGHDLAMELGGIFPKLNIEAVFTESYNAKAKVIERYFKTFQEQFERFVSSFRGASIADKPATLLRNEKWAEKLFKAEPPTIEEALSMIGYYIRYIYGETPHSGLAGKTPWEVFKAAQIPQDRIIEPARLNFMMLSAERKAVRSEGIIWGKLHYWHPALIDQIGKMVIFRYDLVDARWILVYDTKDNFICQAELRRAQHPFIKLAADQPIAHKELNKEYQQIKKLQRQTEHRTRIIVKNTQEAVDKLLSPHIKEITQAANPTFIQTPMLTAPQVEIDESEHSDGTKSFADLLKFAGSDERGYSMKQHKLVKTRNVVEADACISFLINRPKLEMVGLGLLYGRPGYGKTTYAQRIALMQGYTYLRLEATSTPKSFAVQLLSALYHRAVHRCCVPSGSANQLFQRSMQLLEDREDAVIVIDEIDYAYKHEALLGAIRDIVDETLSIVILVGMQTAKDRLAQINPHYFDRCNYFYEFQPANRRDIGLIAKEVMEVEVSDRLIDTIHFNCNGNLRKAIKLMYILESRIKQNPGFSLDNPLMTVEL